MAITDNTDKLLFSSNFNYQKIAFNDSASVSTIAGDSTYTVTHNLGYIPTARIWYEPEYDNGGGSITASNQIWPMTGYQYGDSFNPPFLATTIRAYLTTTQLVITVTNERVSTIPVYWRIYYDA